MATEQDAPRMLTAKELAWLDRNLVVWAVDPFNDKMGEFGLRTKALVALRGHVTVLTEQLAHMDRVLNYQTVHMNSMGDRLSVLEVVAQNARAFEATVGIRVPGGDATYSESARSALNGALQVLAARE